MSAGYLAPELIRRQPQTEAVDIFAAGVLWQLVSFTGILCFYFRSLKASEVQFRSAKQTACHPIRYAIMARHLPFHGEGTKVPSSAHPFFVNHVSLRL